MSTRLVRPQVPDEKRLQTRVSYDDQDGMLMLTTKKVTFTMSGERRPSIIVPIGELKQFFVSKPDVAVVKLKIKLTSGAEHTFVLTTDNAREKLFRWKSELTTLITKQRGINGSQPSSLPPSNAPSPAPSAVRQRVASSNAPSPVTRTTGSPGSGASSPARRKAGVPSLEEIKLRKALLSRNADLAKLHQDLVLGRHITEEDFWEQRKHLLRDQAAKAEQKKGRSSTQLDVKPVTEESGEFKIKITPQIINDIFEQYPSVKQAYVENVPDKVSEEDFWKRYFQSKLFHRKRTTGDRLKNQAKDDIFDKCYAEDEDELIHGPKRIKLDLNRLIDLNATAEDHLESGNQPDVTMRPGQGKSLPLLRQFNRHAERILKSLSEKSDQGKEGSRPNRQKSYYEEIVMEDLDRPKAQEKVVLDIKDQSRYFESLSTAVGDAVAANGIQLPTNVLTRMREAFENWKPELRQPLVRPEVVRKVTASLNRAVTRKSVSMGQRQNFAVRLPLPIEQQVNSIHAAGKEFLRHFWSTFGSTSPERADKNRRMTDQIRKTVDRIEELVQAAGPEDGKRVRELLQHTDTALQRALGVKSGANVSSSASASGLVGSDPSGASPSPASTANSSPANGKRKRSANSRR